MQAVKTKLSADDLLKVETPCHAASVSSDGRWVAGAMRATSTDFEIGILFSKTGAPHATEGAQVRVWDTSTGERFDVGAGLNRSWFPEWNPAGDTIAFYSDANDTVQLWAWSIGDEQARLVSDRTLLARPPHFSMDQPSWSPDGSKVLVLLRPDDWTPPAPPTRGLVVESSLDGPTVDVLESPAPPPSAAPDRAQNPWAPQSHLAWIEVATGEVTVIARDLQPQSALLCPDGTKAAVLVHHFVPEDPTSPIQLRLDLVDLASGEVRVLAAGLRHTKIDMSLPFPLWSTDGQLVWVRDGVLEVLRASGEVEQVPCEVALEELLLGWADTGSVIALRAGDAASWSGGHSTVWTVSITDGTATQLALPETSGRPTLFQDSRGIAAVEGDVLVMTQHSTSRDQEVWRLPLSGDEATRVYSVEGTFAQPLLLSAGEIFLRYEDEATPPRYLLTDRSFSQMRVVVDDNPDIEPAMLGRARFVTWHDDTGAELTGSVLLPPQWDGQPVPVVGELYVGLSFSRFAHRWEAIGGTISHQLLAANGVAVFMPDIPALSPALPPIGGISRFVMPGFDELVAQGIADEEHLGVMGQSGGGLCVNRIVTETPRFRAAIASASVSNLSSWYGQFRLYEGRPAIGGGHHLMEAVLGGPPWAVPEVYIAESPIFRADKIETPLMLIQGELDHTCGVEQAGEMFAALYRLGKPAVFLRYRGEDHAPGHYTGANRRDVSERVLAWWHQHLLAD